MELSIVRCVDIYLHLESLGVLYANCNMKWSEFVDTQFERLASLGSASCLSCYSMLLLVARLVPLGQLLRQLEKLPIYLPHRVQCLPTVQPV